MLKKEILNGNQYLYVLKHKIYSSAIVGGVLPISLGMALSLKRKNQIVKFFVLSVI